LQSIYLPFYLMAGVGKIIKYLKAADVSVYSVNKVE
jgi:hypothetical protein